MVIDFGEFASAVTVDVAAVVRYQFLRQGVNTPQGTTPRQPGTHRGKFLQGRAARARGVNPSFSPLRQQAMINAECQSSNSASDSD